MKPHFELPLLLGMITPLGWLERVPSYKEQQENLSHKDLTTYGFLGYPLLMASDILLYQPEFVPVGQDQQAHVEFTREVARRFNHFYKLRWWCRRTFTLCLPEPKVLLTPSPKLPGTDGRKMSKSYGNTILLTDPEPVVRQKLKTMVTDPRGSGAPIQATRTSARSAICTRCSRRRRPWPMCTKAAGRRGSGASSARVGRRMR